MHPHDLITPWNSNKRHYCIMSYSKSMQLFLRHFLLLLNVWISTRGESEISESIE